MTKAPLLLSIVASLATAPAFASECVAPLNDVKIPNGNKATMQEMVSANHEMQENTTEVESYFRCLKSEQAAKMDAIGPDITDAQKAKIASEYANRQKAETDRLQSLADRYDTAERNFRAKQAEAQSTEDANEQAAAVNGAERDSAEKARHEAADWKAGEKSEAAGATTRANGAGKATENSATPRYSTGRLSTTGVGAPCGGSRPSISSTGSATRSDNETSGSPCRESAHQ
jgi:membrane protein involved in colicin uptake